jgi:hypothetical protein
MALLSLPAPTRSEGRGSAGGIANGWPNRAAALALGASFSWGSSNYLAGLESRRRSVWTVTAVSRIAADLGAALDLLARGPPSPEL